MRDKDKLLSALQKMQLDTQDCSDLEVAYLGYALIQTAAVLHHVPVEDLLLNCAANVNVVNNGGEVEVQISEEDSDE